MIMKNMRLHDDAIAFLRNVRLMDGKIEDRDMGLIPLPKDAPQRAEILIKPMAYAKMIALIQSFSTEIGWHGICKRSAEKDNVFTIEDVFVYPQIVTGTNISTDEAAQDAWNRSFSDEDFKNLRFHGNQPWGFSGTLMLGFWADLDGDDTITLDRQELREGVWMRRDEVPETPNPIDLTHTMMELFRLGLDPRD